MIFEFSGILQRAASTRTVTLPATTLDDALTSLTTQIPDIKRILLDNTGQLRQAHRIVLNDNLLQNPDASLPLGHDDRIAFYTAVAGG
ncbi:MoaD/ThiS family protein [Rhodococcus qingshengii]|uniref:MoaD/ThiS family protein n=1 Tax=Rhodococcus TaxID=1827 RepID=UPI001BB02170|nr:MoaD/ThiS family protein [Rhodococcus qingshengii]MBS3695701.1 MoaD/ThiS family protein [Rhodococcus qingshengii]